MNFDAPMRDESAAAAGDEELDFMAPPKKPLGKKPELGKRPVKKAPPAETEGGDEALA